MAFVDAHCDVLCKLFEHEKADFAKGNGVAASLPRLKEGGALLQFFAIYIPEKFRPFSFEQVLRSVALFAERVAAQPEMVPVRRRSDLNRLVPGEKIGALLALEGVDALPASPWAVRILFELGVRSVGLTWNRANWAADGAGEARAGGLTGAGRRLVAECNRLRMLVDVSHLSERAFWDVAACTRRPFIASHSNVYDCCPHPRNLRAGQIDHMIETGGMIGLTFVPPFLESPGRVRARADSLLRHLDAICARGGRLNVGFGSDFDGFDTPLYGLEHPGKYGTLRDLLLKRYSAEDAQAFLAGNWLRFLSRELPE